MKTFIWNELTLAQKQVCLRRPALQDDAAIKQKVQEIILKVKKEGDAALRELTLKFDRIDLNEIAHTSQAFSISPEMKKCIDIAYHNIYAFHQAQKIAKIEVETSPGVLCEKISHPIQTVGLYIPGGSAPLISTALMLGVPAQIANNPHKILCTPPNVKGEIDLHIMYVAQLCGIDNIYKIGGAQAIAAMAYGTESVLKVDKIFGPGNAFVTAAKQFVAQDPSGASIDLPAGPSEVLVIADDDANPAFVAADLLSQAEHGPDSQVILICLSTVFVEKLQAALATLLPQLARRSIAEQSLAHSAIFIAKDLSEAIAISNQYAPEHLIIQTENPRHLLTHVTCAGSVFLGKYAPEAMGDYASGTNHVLPTYGYARSHSGLGLNDFMLHISVQELTSSGLQHLGPTVEALATLEGLDAHALAVSVRLKELL